jgi:hypothetical protein
MWPLLETVDAEPARAPVRPRPPHRSARAENSGRSATATQLPLDQVLSESRRSPSDVRRPASVLDGPSALSAAPRTARRTAGRTRFGASPEPAQRSAASAPPTRPTQLTEGRRNGRVPVVDGMAWLGFVVLSELRQSRCVCRSIFVTRFLSTKRRSVRSMGFPQTAQMTVFGFLKNIAPPRSSLVETEQPGCDRLSDRLRNVLLDR